MSKQTLSIQGSPEDLAHPRRGICNATSEITTTSATHPRHQHQHQHPLASLDALVSCLEGHLARYRGLGTCTKRAPLGVQHQGRKTLPMANGQETILDNLFSKLVSIETIAPAYPADMLQITRGSMHALRKLDKD